MARNMYGATSADFTLTAGGRVVAGATLTVWSARTGGTQVTDLLDVNSVACTTVTSGADGSVVFYGVDAQKDTLWLDSGQGSRIAVRPVDITGETGATPALTIGTVGTGAAAATLTGTDEEPVLNLTLPPAGNDSITSAMIAADAVGSSEIAANAVGASELADNAVDTAAIATGSVTAEKILIGAATVGSGTGTPEGVVTAAPGSTWLQTDSTTDVKGWIKWVKASGTGNTGWVAGAEADTGWRDVTAGLSSAGTTKYPNLKAAIRRFGKQVEMVVYTGASSVDGAASTIIYAIPAGFKAKTLWTYRSPTGAMIYAVNGTPATGAGLYVGSGEMLAIGQTATAGVGSSVVGSLTWSTEQTWPTSLPGDAA